MLVLRVVIGRIPGRLIYAEGGPAEQAYSVQAVGKVLLELADRAVLDEAHFLAHSRLQACVLIEGAEGLVAVAHRAHGPQPADETHATEARISREAQDGAHFDPKSRLVVGEVPDAEVREHLVAVDRYGTGVWIAHDLEGGHLRVCDLAVVPEGPHSEATIELVDAVVVHERVVLPGLIQ
eukprot:scaffold12160_cov60-Phaeocystis_antarctica.AAC.3